ncbi:hypothetical protein M3Y99_00387500 [Aphelenchoides fujianensis]|nr:hypothetical protein M3Y99_00387500 [Aphelenchoides fujianensis]
MKLSLGDEFVVVCTHRFGLRGRGEERHVLEWRDGRRIGELFDASSDVHCYKSEDYSSTVSIQLRVDDQPPVGVEVPRSLRACDLAEHQDLTAASVHAWWPRCGFIELGSWSTVKITESNSYWIQTAAYRWRQFGRQLAADVDRLVARLPIGKPPQADVAVQVGGEQKSKAPTGFNCRALTFLIPFALVLLLGALVWAMISLTPAGQVTRELPTSTTTSNKQRDDGVMALLKELNEKFDAERAQRDEQLEEQRSTIQQLQAANQKSEQKVALLEARIAKLKDGLVEANQTTDSISPAFRARVRAAVQRTWEERKEGLWQLFIICLVFIALSIVACIYACVCGSLS